MWTEEPSFTGGGQGKTEPKMILLKPLLSQSTSTTNAASSEEEEILMTLMADQ